MSDILSSEDANSFAVFQKVYGIDKNLKDLKHLGDCLRHVRKKNLTDDEIEYIDTSISQLVRDINYISKVVERDLTKKLGRKMLELDCK